MLGYDEKISIRVSPNVEKNGNALILSKNNRKNIRTTKDGKITVDEHEITIYEGSIEEAIRNESGVMDYMGLDVDNAIGAVAGHESVHIEKENTKQSLENREKRGNHDVEKRPNEIESEILKEPKENNVK